MSGSTLYDEDILLWSEQQADVIRRLGQTRRDLPNELDIENLAEEIESVGRSELAAVESQLQNVLSHLIKLYAEPESDAVRHWRGEIVTFQSEAVRRYSSSMRKRIDLDRLWRSACRQSIAGSANPSGLARALPQKCPFYLDDLLSEEVEIPELIDELGKRGTNFDGASG